jgi:hypothetical protein
MQYVPQNKSLDMLIVVVNDGLHDDGITPEIEDNFALIITFVDVLEVANLLALTNVLGVNFDSIVTTCIA